MSRPVCSIKTNITKGMSLESRYAVVARMDLVVEESRRADLVVVDCCRRTANVVRVSVRYNREKKCSSSERGGEFVQG